MSDLVEERDLQHSTDDLYRYSNASRVAPDPPRGVKVRDGNTLWWEEPFNLSGVTHYRVYLNTDTPDGLEYEVSVGQTQVFVWEAERALVSSYNKPMDTESLLVQLLQDGTPEGAPITPPSTGGGGPIGDELIRVAYEQL